MSDSAALRSGSIRPDVQVTGKLIAANLLRLALGFRDCPHEAIDELAAAGNVATLDKGQTLVLRGAPFDKLCLVLEGSLEISVSQPNGRRALLAHIRPGDVAGIMSLLDHLPHPSDMVARQTPTRVLLVPGADFRAVRQRHPSIGEALALQLAYRSRLLHERMIVDSSMSLEVRLARQLHLLAALSGPTRHRGVPITMRMSQADLGDLLGVGRPRANFALQQLRREGLIELQYATVVIVDPEGLARRAGL